MARAAEDRHAPPPDAADQGVIAAITVLLLAGLPLPVLLQRLSGLLAPIGVPALALAQLVAMVGIRSLRIDAPSATRPATRTIQRGVAARRAMYLLAAARRLARGGTLAAERRLFAAHRVAEDRRRAAAARIDRAAAAHGPLLGWKARLDERTTPLCRSAHGRNFSALRPPAIGWPGTLHAGNCRCLPRAPWRNARLLG